VKLSQKMASKSGGGSKSSQSTKGGKQTTLFQTWGYSGNESVLSTSGAGIKTDNSASQVISWVGIHKTSYANS